METKNDAASALVAAFRKEYEVDPLRFEDLPGATLSWNPRKLVALFGLVSKNPDSEPGDFAEVLRLERGVVTRKANSMDWDAFGAKLKELCSKSSEECLESAAETHRYKMLARAFVKQRRVKVDRMARDKHVREMLLEEIVPLRTPARVDVLPPTHKGLGTPEHAVLLLSDTHVGLDFTRLETGGLNEYNVEIFKQRAESLRLGVVEIIRLHTRLYPIPELHVLSLGDIVHGTNMGGQWGPAYNAVDVFKQVGIAGDAICSCLSTWSRLFKAVHFHGVIGNHGRAGIKNSEKIPANFDNFVYTHVEGRMKLHDNVTVHNEQSWWGHKSVNGTEFAFLHGDLGGSSLNDLRKEEQKNQGLLAQQIGKLFDVLCVGHIHTHANVETTTGEVFVNGSFVGGDIYSMHDLSRRSRPTQTFLGVHPENKITWRYNLNLDIKRA